MDDRRIPAACALIMCCALFRSAVADCPGRSVLTAGVAQASSADSLNGRQSQRVLLSDSEAVASFQQKSNHGDVDAMNQLGIMYARGRGVIKDYGIALKWFRESALKGYPPAMVNLGTMYQLGWADTATTCGRMRGFASHWPLGYRSQITTPRYSSWG